MIFEQVAGECVAHGSLASQISIATRVPAFPRRCIAYYAHNFLRLYAKAKKIREFGLDEDPGQVVGELELIRGLPTITHIAVGANQIQALTARAVGLV